MIAKSPKCEVEDTDMAQDQDRTAKDEARQSLNEFAVGWLDRVDPEWRIREMSELYSTKPEGEK